MQKVLFFFLSVWLHTAPAWAQFDPPPSIGKDTTPQDVQALYESLSEMATLRRTDQTDTFLLAFERADDEYEEMAHYVLDLPRLHGQFRDSSSHGYFPPN
jgi:hypothetical protein